MKQENLSQTIEDYIKAIYELTLENERASTTRIAEVMELQPSSVTAMVQKQSQGALSAFVLQYGYGAGSL
jgi:Mn-dependent DtxR family transcriptional regulator